MVVVEFKHQLTRTDLGAFAQEDLGSEMALQLFERLADVRIDVGFGLFLVPSCAARSQALDLPNGQSAAGGALCKAHAQLRVRHGKQGAAMAGTELPFLDPVLNRRFEFEQADRVRNGRAVLAGSFGNRFLRHLELVHQPLKGASCFHGVQVLALNVLDKRHFKRKFVRYLTNDRRHAAQAGALRGPPTSFTGDQLIAGPYGPDDDGLYDSAGLD